MSHPVFCNGFVLFLSQTPRSVARSIKSSTTSGRVLLAGSGAPWKHSNFMPKTNIFEVLRDPRGVKIGPQRLLGPFLERLGLMEACWSALGGFLERSWAALGPKKTNLDRLLAGPRPPRRPVSACLGAKYLPKRSPGGSKNEVRKRSKLKMAKPLKSPTVARILMFV